MALLEAPPLPTPACFGPSHPIHSGEKRLGRVGPGGAGWGGGACRNLSGGDEAAASPSWAWRVGSGSRISAFHEHCQK